MSGIPLKTLAPPWWFRVLFPFLVLGAVFLLLVYPAWYWFAFSQPTNLETLVARWAALVVMGGFIWSAAKRMWLENGFRATATEQGIAVKTRSKSTFVQWNLIGACDIVPSDQGGHSGYWVTLTDRSGKVLVQWDRNWFRFSQRSLHQFDEFTALIQQRIAMQ